METTWEQLKADQSTMSKPEISHMITYLQRMGIKLTHLDPAGVEAEYFRNIYQVQPREKVLPHRKQRPDKPGLNHKK